MEQLSNILNMPYEVLVGITGGLDLSDLLSLRLLNKKYKRVVEALPLWRDLSLKEWLSYDDQIQEDKMRAPIDFRYFISRCRDDMKVKTKLRQIQDGLLSNKELMDAVWSLSDKYGNKLTPVLNKIINRPNPEKTLRMGFFASAILDATRRKSVYKLLDQTQDKSIKCSSIRHTHCTYENFFFTMAHVDPAFDTLLPFRKLVIGKVKDNVIYDSQFIKLSSTEKLLKVYFHLVKEIENVNGGAKVQFKRSCEDISILRVYAGEQIGLPLMRLAILEKIGRDLGINCQILKTNGFKLDDFFTNGVLKVLDDTVPKGVSYIRTTPDCFRKKDISLVAMDFDGFKLYLESHGKIKRKAHNLESKLLQEFSLDCLSNYLMLDLALGDQSKWNFEAPTIEKEEVFPRSKECLLSSAVSILMNYVLNFHSEQIKSKSFKSFAEEHMGITREMFDNSDIANPRKFICTIPYDLGVIHNSEFFKTFGDKDTLQKKLLVDIFSVDRNIPMHGDDINEKLDTVSSNLPEMFPGQSLKAEDGILIVVGYKIDVGVTNSYILYHTRKNCLCTADFAKDSSPECFFPKPKDISRILQSREVGFYFQNFDDNSHRFIPIKAIQDYYPGFERLKYIKSFTEQQVMNKKAETINVKIFKSDIHGNKEETTIPFELEDEFYENIRICQNAKKAAELGRFQTQNNNSSSASSSSTRRSTSTSSNRSTGSSNASTYTRTSITSSIGGTRPAPKKLSVAAPADYPFQLPEGFVFLGMGNDGNPVLPAGFDHNRDDEFKELFNDAGNGALNSDPTAFQQRLNELITSNSGFVDPNAPTGEDSAGGFFGVE